MSDLIYESFTAMAKKAKKPTRPVSTANAYWARSGLMDLRARGDTNTRGALGRGMGDHPCAMGSTARSSRVTSGERTEKGSQVRSN